MSDIFICNKCGAETTERPANKNSICTVCGRGRYRLYRTCSCGKVFHPDKYKQMTCSKECGYKIRKPGKAGKHYPHLQRARIGICPVCGKEFRDDFTCQECGARGVHLEAHHIKPKHSFPDLVFDVNNGITLCHDCHAKTDSYGSKARRKEQEL